MHLFIGGKLEFVLKVDEKGRILIPSEIRSMLNMRGAVRARVEVGRLVIEPIRDPLDLLTSSVIQGTVDVEKQIKKLRKIALREAMKRVEERWPQ